MKRNIFTSVVLLPSAMFVCAEDIMIVKEKDSLSGLTSVEKIKASTHNILIGREKIEESAAKNLTELLLEQGVAAEQAATDYDENVIMLRGFGTEHLNTEANGTLLILINGKRSGIASANQIMLDNVERVEIIRGAGMYKYSASSPGGVINIITRRGTSAAQEARVYFRQGSSRYSRGGISASGAWGDLGYSVGYMQARTGSDYKDAEGQRIYSTKTDGTSGIWSQLDYIINENQSLNLFASYYDVDHAWRPAYVDDDGDDIAKGYTDRRSKIVNLEYQFISPEKGLAWTSSVGRNEDQYSVFSDKKYPKTQRVVTVQARTALDWYGEKSELSSGMELVNYRLENGGASDNPWYGNTDWPITRHPTSSTQNIGAWLVGSHMLMERLSVNGGLRYDFSRAKDKSVGDEEWDKYSYFAGLRREDFASRRTFSHLSPSLGLSYLINDGLKIRADYTQSWRAPTGRQLFASRRTEGYGAGGDPRLDAEKTNAFELGFDAAGESVDLSASWFFYATDDYIYLNYYTNPTNPSTTGGRVMRNAQKRYQSGIEIQSSAELMNLFDVEKISLRPWINLVHMTKHEEILERGASGLEGRWWPIVRMPSTVVNYGLRLGYPEAGFSANLNVTYSGRRLPGRANATPVGRPADSEFGGFSVANLHMKKTLWTFSDRSSLGLKASVTNLFNKEYSSRGRVGTGSGYTYPHPGRQYFAELEYRFGPVR